ncbi:MAG: histidine--tRNA ligase [Campylobacter sp.]|nr:histidine--tRNA ligase [Campylobacter sp.]
MIQAIKGMKDLLDDDARLYEKIVNVCSQIATSFGYKYINLPHLEMTNLFRRSVGESSDIVGKEMYEFTDKGGNEVCLRPEGTAGAVRAFIESKMDRAKVTKRWFYHGSMFRYEKPQKGRLREFHQFGIECFNIDSVYEDASVIMILDKIFKTLDIKTTLKINSLGDKESMKNYRNLLVNFLDTKDGLCEDCLRRKKLNPIRVLDCKKSHCQELIKDAPLLIDNLNKECEDEFNTLKNILDDNGISYEVDPKLVRGLDYYCKTAFEFVSDEIGAQSAVAGGGRYDRLVEYLGGKSSFGVGFAMGIERIMEILNTKEQSNSRNGVYLCVLDEKYLPLAFKIANLLRDNYQVELEYTTKSLQKGLKSADNKNALIFACIGENEANNKEIWTKNLQTKQEKIVKFDDLRGLE